MDDLISRSALLAAYDKAHQGPPGGARKLIEEAPAAVVHCKDCVNCIKEPNGDLYCDVLAIGYEPLGSKRVTEDWFCADGERKA